MKKKKRAGNETVMGYCPFGVGSRYNVLYRDMRGLGAHGQAQHDRAGAQRHAAACDTALRYGQLGYDTTGLCAGRAAARAHMAWPLECVTIQNVVSWRRGSLVSRHGLLHGAQRLTIRRRSDATRHPVPYDTA